MIYNKEVLKSNLCDYNDVYILVRGNIAIGGHNITQVAFKNCDPYIKCITKFDVTIIDDPADLDLVMPLYNLLEYSSSYSDTTVSLWFYTKVTNFYTNIANFKSFMYKVNYCKKLKPMEQMES